MAAEGNPAPQPECKEPPQPGELYFLWHPTTTEAFSGFGLTLQQGRRGHLVGLLMVDRPQPVNPKWLADVQQAFGECSLVRMAESGERGILCQLRVDKESLPLLRAFPDAPKIRQIQRALTPLLEQPPSPVLKVHWDTLLRRWHSEFWIGLPREMQLAFEQIGYGCLAVETEERVSVLTYAADADIERFRNRPIVYQWELVKMPTAPLIHFRALVLDDPRPPYVLEHCLNITDSRHARILEQLLQEDYLHIDFFGDGFEYRYSKQLDHPFATKVQLYQIADQAIDYWMTIPPQQQDFQQARRAFERQQAA